MSDHQLNRRGFLASLSATSIFATELQLNAANSQTADLIVYGGTSAGIGAAIQAARMGKSVIVIEPGRHIGGLTTGGLGYTDSGNKAVVGGIAREFYRLLKKHYADPSNWKYDSPKSLKNYRQIKLHFNSASASIARLVRA
jgi:ribulose 1,5-bisphosphate synthetase/thiazole synthase